MKLLQEVNMVLAQFPAYWDKDILLKTKVIDDIRNYKKELIQQLLANDAIKEAYSVELEQGLIFKIDEFINMFRYKNYWENSYTQFSNEIGLTSDQKYLNYSSDVVLDFPHKDCLLEGGMTKDNVGKKEMFYHQVLAKEEIDVLLDQKVLIGSKRYSADGEEEISSYEERDNLVIKGNNLLALHTLQSRFTEQVKFIYIDPPYNTGGDSFKYNDRFNRSTWLVFMKNRLEIAMKLLKKDGVIAVQCSFHEYAYLKVLMDNLFGAERAVVTFNCLVRHPDRSITADKEFNDVVEYILIYSKSDHYKLPKRSKEKTDDAYVYHVEVTGDPIERIECDSKIVEVYSPDQYKLVKGEPSSDKLKTLSIRGSIREKNSSGRFYVKHLEKLVGTLPPLTLFKVPNMGDDAQGFRWFHLPKEGNKNGTYLQGMPQGSTTTDIPYPNFLDFVEQYNRVNYEGEVEFRNGKKPEELLQFLIELLSSEREIVLDFFAGSGTTAAVCHKLNRQYITIEQMDYIRDVTVERLKKVIEGEQGGISKETEWEGGGSFVYTELCELNQLYLSKLQEVETDEELEHLIEEMKQAAYLDYKVDVERLTNEDSAFAELSFSDKKNVLIESLDANQLYLNYSEIDDALYEITDVEKQFNHSFYRQSGDRS